MNQGNTATDRSRFDMSGGTLKDASIFIKAAYLAVGAEVVGIFENLNPKVGKFGKPAIFLTLTAPLTYSDNKNAEKTYQIGESVGMNVCGNLGRLLSEKNPRKGDEVLVVYKGSEVITTEGHAFKGEESHTFELGVARNGSTTTTPDTETLPE